MSLSVVSRQVRGAIYIYSVYTYIYIHIYIYIYIYNGAFFCCFSTGSRGRDCARALELGALLL